MWPFKKNVNKEFFKKTRKPDELEERIVKIVRSNTAPPKRGTAEILDAFSSIGALWSVQKRVSESVASVPIKAWYRKDRASRRAKSVPLSAICSKEGREAFRNEAIVAGEYEEVTEHPLLDMLAYGNPIHDGRTLLSLTNTYLDLVGEAFWLIARLPNNMPFSYFIIPPYWVTDIPGATSKSYMIRIGSSYHNIEPENIIYFKDLDPKDPYGRGTGLCGSIADELDTDDYAAIMAKAVFYNNGRPSGLISVDGSSEPEMKRVKEKFDQDYRGVAKSGRLHFSNYPIKYTPIDQSIADVQLIELRKFVRGVIRQTYGVPPEMVGEIESSNRATITEAENIMAKMVTMPRIERILSVVQIRLAPQFDERLIIEAANILKEGVEKLKEMISAAPWAFTVNQIQRAAGEDGFGDAGEVRYVPIGLIEVQQGAKMQRPVKQLALESCSCGEVKKKLNL